MVVESQLLMFRRVYAKRPRDVDSDGILHRSETRLDYGLDSMTRDEMGNRRQVFDLIIIQTYAWSQSNLVMVP